MMCFVIYTFSTFHINVVCEVTRHTFLDSETLLFYLEIFYRCTVCDFTELAFRVPLMKWPWVFSVEADINRWIFGSKCQ